MRVLPSEFLKEQRKGTVDPAIKIYLSYGGSNYTFYEDRILDLNHREQVWSHRANIILHNRDGYFTDLDLKGYSVELSYGLKAKSETFYSQTAPLKLITPILTSYPGELRYEIRCVGIPDLMDMDEASESYRPEETDTNTVKDLLDKIAGATLDCFDHCTAYTIVWDDEDAIYDTYMPKDNFWIPVGGLRLSAFKRLLDFTSLVPIFKSDGYIHIIKPKTTGIEYDAEYELGEHAFLVKEIRKGLVIPNCVRVQSRENDDPLYAGDACHSDMNILRVNRYYELRLQSDSQAKAIAEVVVGKAELRSELGSISVPVMHAGQELFDYVNVTDSRQGDSKTGNIGEIVRKYSPRTKNSAAEHSLTFSFGGWHLLKDWEAGQLSGSESQPVYIDEAHIKNLFVEFLQASTILCEQLYCEYLSAITADMGLLNAGEIRIGTGSLYPDEETATGGSTTTVVDSTKAWTTDEHKGKEILIEVAGVEYQREVTANTATQITFSPAITGGVLNGSSYWLSGGTFTGWRLWTEAGIGRMAGYNSGAMQFYVGSDGKLYAGAGAVILDASGLSVYGQLARFYDTDEVLRGWVFGSTGGYFMLVSSGSSNLWLGSAGGTIVTNATLLRPATDGGASLGDATYQYGKGFFKNRLKIPVGADKYD